MPPDPLALALRRRGSMVRYAVLSVAALAFLAGCAGEGGWKGPGAQPLAEALADCKARTSAMGGKTGRAFAIDRSEEHTSELQSLMRISFAVFCLKKKTKTTKNHQKHINIK